MKLLLSLCLTIIFNTFLTASIINPYKNINNSDKINALVEYFIQEEINRLPRPPKELKIEKSMFEKKTAFEIRAQKKQKQYDIDIKNYQKQINNIKKQVNKTALKKAITVVYGIPRKKGKLEYDSESEHFFTKIQFKNGKTQKIAIKVPLGLAKKFHDNYDRIRPQAVYSHDKSNLTLKGINYTFNEKSYEALLTDKAYESDPIAINIKSDYAINTTNTVKIASYKNPEIKKLNEALLEANRNKSKEEEIQRLKKQLAIAQGLDVSYIDDLPKLLEKTSQAKTDDTKWLFIIGIEKYTWTQDIIFSTRSAKMFKNVMKKSLGIPENNVFTLLDEKATLGSIKNRLNKMLRRVKKTDTVYFYYNGHGIPIPTLDNEPYLLASDIEPDFVADDTFFSLNNIYKTLSSSNAKQIVAFVDSCFSGSSDGKSILKGIAATRLIPKKVDFDQTKMVVLSAGKEKQYSNPYPQKGHRLFSYFIMKSILEGQKEIKTIHQNTFKKVKNTSYSEYGDLRQQHPTIDGNRELKL